MLVQYIVVVLPAYQNQSNTFCHESFCNTARLHAVLTEIYLNEFFFFELSLYQRSNPRSLVNLF